MITPIQLECCNGCLMIMTEPKINTAWIRKCNGTKWVLTQIHDFFGKRMVWIGLLGTNKCYHIPLKTLLKRYEQVPEVRPELN